jgi:hypothetical protein
MAGMNEPGLVHLELELDASADPVEGWLVVRGGDRERFTGWIQLAAALERIRVGGPPPAPVADRPG